MRVGSAGQGGFGLVPYGASGAAHRRREEIEPPDPAGRARADVNSAFATSRHPFVQVESTNAPRRGRSYGTYAGQTVEGTPSPPSVAFLAQYIAQENLREGLELDKAADGTRAYRRAEGPPATIRAGANVDTAA